MRILVIGESCTDIYVYGSSSRLCPEAPVPVFQPLYTSSYGGMASNVYENIKSIGINVDIITNKNYNEITKLRYIDDKSNHMFLRIDNNDNLYGKVDISSVEKIIHEYDAVIVSDYNKGYLSETDINLIGKLHSVVFLDTKKQLGNWAKSVKYIKINNFEYEHTKLFVDDDLYNNLIVTKGSAGCMYKGITYNVPIVNVKNTCGAGDTFIAALTCKYIETGDITDAIIYANEFATTVIQDHGPVYTKTVKR